MKTYPSIRQARKPFRAHVFDKLDGSNLRISWNRKQGWYEFATRTRTIATNHKLYRHGYAYFLDTYADALAQIAQQQRWKRLDAFFEFCGANSFAGRHDLSDQQQLTLIDLTPNTRGLLNPIEFLDLFSHLPLPTYLGEVEWDGDYIEQVRQGNIEGVTFEGVVAKSATRQRMAKAKTQAWIDRVLKEFGNEKGGEMIKS